MTETLSEPLPPGSAGLRSLFADSAIYGLSAAALPVALIVATPLVARKLGPGGFGTVDVLTTLVSLLGVLGAAGMDSAAARSYFDYSAAQEDRRRTVIRTALVVVLAGSAAVALVVAAVGALLATSTRTTVTVAAIVVAAGLMPVSNSQLIARVSFLLARRRTAYLVASLVNAALGAGAAVVLVRLGLGPAGYFAGLALGAVVALTFCLKAGGLVGGAPWLDRREAGIMLRYGLPLVPAAAAAWMIFAVDRALIAALKGFDDAGQYGLAAKVTAPMLLIATAFATAWGPFIMRHRPERRLELRARALPAITAAAGAVYVWLVLFAEPLVEVLGGSRFESADRAVPGIALGWLFWTVAIVLQTEPALERKTKVIALVTGIGAVVNVLANVVLIPPFGFVGAAWATALSFGVLVLLYAAYERRVGPPPYHRWRIAAVALVIGAASAAVLVDDVAVRWAAAVAATLALAVAAIVRRGAPR